MASYNLKLAFEQFTQADSVKTKKRLSTTLKFVLKQYVLPLWKGQKYKDREIESHFEGCLAKISIEEFRHPPLIEDVVAHKLQALVTDGKLKRGTADNYRSALNKFIKWMQSQDWYLEAVGTENVEAESSPFKSRDLRTARKRQKRTRVKIFDFYPVKIPLRLERQIEAGPDELKVEDFGVQLQHKFQQRQWRLPTTGLRCFYLLKPELFQETPSNSSLEKQVKDLVDDIHQFLWWKRIVRQQSLDQLDLVDITNPDLLSEFTAWGHDKRRCLRNGAAGVLSFALKVSQWLYHLNSSDLFLQDIEELNLLSEMFKENFTTKSTPAKDSNHVVLEEYLSIEECEKILLELRQDCEPNDVRGLPRTHRAIMLSWQRYLISGLTYYSGLHPAEIRQLKIQQLIFKEDIGDCVVIYLDFQECTWQSRHVLLPKFIVADLNDWMTIWRNRVNPKHDFVFFSLGANNNLDTEGQPLDSTAVNAILSRAIYKHSGKMLAPSILRRFAALRLVPLSLLSKSLLHEMLEIDLSNTSSTKGIKNFFSQILLRDRIIRDLGLSFNDFTED
ncbi:hypothetical protein C7B76_02545 [filamentous cyanobacterium CCP2]|nr:hypothetical protein C7B76_02545 [filamentous cyanobacterium CCP2]